MRASSNQNIFKGSIHNIFKFVNFVGSVVGGIYSRAQFVLGVVASTSTQWAASRFNKLNNKNT
jgi:hypothetical protein